MRTAPSTAGFTLLELLIGMGLFAIVSTALLSVVVSSSKATAQLNTVASMQSDLVSAQQILANRLKAAWYIAPASTSVTLTTNPLTSNVLSSGPTWVVGTQPFIAAILFPATPGSGCAPTATPAVTAGCYRFVAYYPVQRSVWVANTAGSQDPGPDATNDTTSWVLAEYLSYFSTTPTTAMATNAATNTTGAQINLLVDRISPTTTAPTYTMFTPQSVTRTTNPSNFSTGWPLTYSNGVSVQLRTRQIQSGKVVQFPSGTTTLQTSIYPENVGVNGQ